MKQIFQIHLLEDRPESIPDNMRIFNAPRPINGAMNWESRFIHGCYYVADSAPTKHLMDMDAWEIIYHDEHSAKDMLKKHYPEKLHNRIDLLSYEQTVHQLVAVNNRMIETRKKNEHIKGWN